MLNNYYQQHYPVELLNEVLTPHAEIVLQLGGDREPIRNIKSIDLHQMILQHCPADGAHVAFPDHSTSPLLIDVDLPGPSSIGCTCTDECRQICDNCWVTLAGTLRAYQYIFRKYYACTQMLAAFSGGRGWHLYVFDCQNIVRSVVYDYLAAVVSDVVEQVHPLLCAMRSQHGDRAYDLTAIEANLDPLVVGLYRDVLLPYFCTEWIPRVLNSSVCPDKTVPLLMEIVQARYPSAEHAVRQSIASATRLYSNSSRTEPRHRLDLFVVLLVVLWLPPDSALKSKRHPIRLWWSPHARSGNYSLPLAPNRAHMLRPRTQPPRLSEVGHAGTTGDSWFRLSIDVVMDLLESLKRSPGFGVRIA